MGTTIFVEYKGHNFYVNIDSGCDFYVHSDLGHNFY